jgi:hypothetical protein
MLESCRAQALELHQRLAADARYAVGPEPELDIVVWAVRDPDLARASAEARRIFDAEAAQGRHLALAELPARFFPALGAGSASAATVLALRSVLMKAR